MALKSYIPYGRQDINQNDIDAVSEVLQSDFLTQGDCVPRFEKAVSDYCSAKYGVAVNSGTSALHLACLSLGLGPGDWLWTSPITFVASANCGLFCGAKIDFVDIDPLSFNLCVNALKEKLIKAEKLGTLPKILVPVHMCGQSCDMEEIKELSKKYKFKILEDASHAIGGKYQNKAIGSCIYSDITILSFHPVKIITTGEGGMALTNNSDIAESLELLRSHGITRDPNKMTHQPDGDWYYQQIDLGFNYRITDLQAALGNSQLKRLDDYVFSRHQIANRYNGLLSDLPLSVPHQSSKSFSAFHLYVIQLEDSDKRDKIFSFLRENNIGVNVHYIPVHQQPYYQKMGFKSGDFPNSENYYLRAISLPIYPTMTERMQDKIVKTLERAIRL